MTLQDLKQRSEKAGFKYAYGQFKRATEPPHLVAIATGLLIYNNMTKPRDYNNHDNLDEDFNGCKNSNNKSIRIRKSIESAMWAIIVVIYLLISFITFAWHITWVIFVIGAAIEKIIRAHFECREID